MFANWIMSHQPCSIEQQHEGNERHIAKGSVTDTAYNLHFIKSSTEGTLCAMTNFDILSSASRHFD